MNDQQWLIKVNGIDEIRVDAGQTVEIGRKPLRPAPVEDGVRRLDVEDSTKSMSKRHARFVVAESGTATLKDLASTNGTYVVRDDGELMQVPSDKAFQLPRSPMRFQFGDVPVDFIMMPREEKPAEDPVADLFSYAASDNVQQDVDAASMSVDDILDLRAGEPTGLLSTTQVRSRIDALHDQAIAESRRQRQSEAAGSAGAINGGVEPFIVSKPDMGAADAAASGAQASAASQTPSTPAQEAQTQVIAPQSGSAESGAGSSAAASSATTGDAAGFAGSAALADGGQNPAFVMERDLFHDAAQQASASSASSSASSQPQFTPVFEAGSVFERLSKGETEHEEPGIEVDGLSSADAKTTRDFDLQFEMARHPELLPFLALNPSLYDDLYKWLELQGNADIDQALKNNQGYQEYLAGKGE
ncbi:FHA domain-containing protein [Bifidobacterium sp. SMB2]|uniref:FHA domain-containing protein n=1 Tax=Bifidobacterium saimiriisciurei TaxID=2661627 RepID=A0ABX0CEH1_9BIFI|nr:FHA domain-containing protein [Bifidobacterium saimiriisciurei]NEG96385.1 FHA domain-containing protein [Bifidobacterium sp. SMB2]NEH10983.1 FHA domain-containing protein [Bifidobacterium saimiriisciurei]